VACWTPSARSASSRSLCMKPLSTSRAAEICCNVTVALGILIIGGTTAGVWHPTTASSPQLIHAAQEIDYMAGILNVALPIALLALVASAVVKTWRKSFHPVGFYLSSAALVVVSACALVMYSRYVAAHPGANLWSRMWWAFTS
jgi:hypothetical protein